MGESDEKEKSLSDSSRYALSHANFRAGDDLQQNSQFLLDCY